MEYVIHAEAAGRSIGRADAILERVGRTTDPRNMDAGFDQLVAAKARYPIRRVLKHTCHHDEGIGNCNPGVTED